ncbi:MAG: PQQ-like beta-propeller repeat protein [Gemmataceae bacterium]|nr:PQQ-like beta-propeller repeat protein [Gemmataceae bacterium]
MRAFVAVVALAGAVGADWPTLLGPTRDGVSPETGIVAPWPRDGLRKLWDCPLGLGYAPPVVAGGKLYHFDRFGDDNRLTCRDAATGKELWAHSVPTEYRDFYGYDPGPRACPVVDGDRVYVFGPEGVLACVGAADGKERWKLDTAEKYHVHQNFFGVGSVPVVHGDLLLVAVGGSPPGRRPADLREAKPDGTCIVAFDKLAGAEKWRAGADLASYSSPVVKPLGGKPTGLYFARGGLFGFDPQTGAERFRFPWRSKLEESVNAANPSVVGDKVLLTECYGPGAVLLDLKDGMPAVVWSDADKDRGEESLKCHWNTPVVKDGFVYGSSGRNSGDADLRCVELATGDVKWRQRRTYRCTLTLVDNHLVCLSEAGRLSLLRPNPAKYDEVSGYVVPELEYPCWAPPVVADGRLYVRGKSRLVCLELIPKK